MNRVHIIGAGLAGLSAAVALARRGVPATLYEAGPAAGGRCRSYFDRALDCRIDNGNHLILSGNRATLAYLDTVGARATLRETGEARFPFVDLASGERWTLAPNPGRLPWWILCPSRRVPGTGWRDYLSLGALAHAKPDATVAEALAAAGPLYRRLLGPLAVAALNTPPEQGLARLLQRVVAETLGRGGRACVPLFPRVGLSETLVDPALAWLALRGTGLITGCRVSALRLEAGRVAALKTPGETIPVAPREAVVMAVPPWVATELLPGLTAPDAFQAIVNLHFRTDAAPGFAGLIGGTAEWVFAKPGMVSVTISAANRLADLTADELAARVWPELRLALGLAGEMPPVRVLKERRATFAATTAQEHRRPGAGWSRTGRPEARNLALAGDWTATGLPATIEGAIRSGIVAAESILSGA
jgi:hydroxysqualene dehydroxylase